MAEREFQDRGLQASRGGEGWLLAAEVEPAKVDDLCFAHRVLLQTSEIAGESVNALAGAIADAFLESARTERFNDPWPFVFECASGLEGLGRRTDAVQEAVLDLIRAKISRVAKLAQPSPSRWLGVRRGLFVYFVDFKKAYLAREAWSGGQWRMADDPLAPSRSYLKVEEAYGLLGREPDVEDSVADLGAAPGGWSYSAAKRRATVVAVDNGPLKGGALGHTLIDHRREDAFKFQPAQGQRFDWLFCDLVEDPHHVLKNIVEPWILHGWCRHFVVILKFGRVDPVALLRQVRDPEGAIAKHVKPLRIRHLYHDREEFTLVGEVHR